MKMVHETHEKHEKKTKKICVICVICGFSFFIGSGLDSYHEELVWKIYPLASKRFVIFTKGIIFT